MTTELPNIFPEKVFLPIFGGIEISETLITAYLVTFCIVIFALLFRFVFFKRFKPVPTGFQNVIELIVDSINKFSKSILGKRGATIAGYMFTLALFLVVSGLTELLGARAPGTDLNFTISIALISFVLIAAYGIRYKGLKGWVKSYGQPKGFIAPFKIISDCVLPISMSFRMFGNLFSGLVIMDLVYGALGPFAIAIPSLLSLFFTLFHVGMQTYVFMMLTLSFINEKVE